MSFCFLCKSCFFFILFFFFVFFLGGGVPRGHFSLAVMRGFFSWVVSLEAVGHCLLNFDCDLTSSSVLYLCEYCDDYVSIVMTVCGVHSRPKSNWSLWFICTVEYVLYTHGRKSITWL